MLSRISTQGFRFQGRTTSLLWTKAKKCSIQMQVSFPDTLHVVLILRFFTNYRISASPITFNMFVTTQIFYILPWTFAQFAQLKYAILYQLFFTKYHVIFTRFYFLTMLSNAIRNMFEIC